LAKTQKCVRAYLLRRPHLYNSIAEHTQKISRALKKIAFISLFVNFPLIFRNTRHGQQSAGSGGGDLGCSQAG
jgi:hypothetical protein